MYVHGEVELTGRNVKETITHNAVAIRDTATYDGIGNFDTSSYGRKSVLIVNTLDQPIIVGVYAKATGAANLISLGTAKTIAAGVTDKIMSSDLPNLPDPFPSLRIRANCTVAPTAGSVLIFFEGVPN